MHSSSFFCSFNLIYSLFTFLFFSMQFRSILLFLFQSSSIVACLRSLILSLSFTFLRYDFLYFTIIYFLLSIYLPPTLSSPLPFLFSILLISFLSFVSYPLFSLLCSLFSTSSFIILSLANLYFLWQHLWLHCYLHWQYLCLHIHLSGLYLCLHIYLLSLYSCTILFKEC